ncbi:MAG: WYL domain-containing protein, partial [Actinomycetota bacterium]|nr:WYL domain-containing protein [Actinomycetota bacterium]
LPGVANPAAAARALAGAGPADPDGWSVAELEIESDEVACSQLIALGAGIEVLEPASLRTRLHDLGMAIAHHHRSNAVEDGGPTDCETGSETDGVRTAARD